jgi:hypothetical protein
VRAPAHPQRVLKVSATRRWPLATARAATTLSRPSITHATTATTSCLRLNIAGVCVISGAHVPVQCCSHVSPACTDPPFAAECVPGMTVASNVTCGPGGSTKILVDPSFECNQGYYVSSPPVYCAGERWPGASRSPPARGFKSSRMICWRCRVRTWLHGHSHWLMHDRRHESAQPGGWLCL